MPSPNRGLPRDSANQPRDCRSDSAPPLPRRADHIVGPVRKECVYSLYGGDFCFNAPPIAEKHDTAKETGPQIDHRTESVSRRL